MVDNIFTQYINVEPVRPVVNRRYKIIIDECRILVIIQKDDECFYDSPDLEFRFDEKFLLKSEIWIDIKDFNNSRKFEKIKEKITHSIKALHYADRFFFDANRDLEKSRVIIKFNFESINLCKTYDFGKISNY